MQVTVALAHEFHLENTEGQPHTEVALFVLFYGRSKYIRASMLGLIQNSHRRKLRGCISLHSKGPAHFLLLTQTLGDGNSPLSWTFLVKWWVNSPVGCFVISITSGVRYRALMTLY